MKTMKKLLSLFILASVPLLASAQDKNKNIETVKFKTSIDCEACVNKIMTNLPHEKGVKDVKCDLETKEVAISYTKDKNNVTELRKSLEKLGYTAKEIKNEEEKPVKK
jgi:copper chaperone CopZ